MKSLCGLIFAGLLAVAPAAAQFSMRIGALGGAGTARATGRPLGGFGPGYNRGTYRNGYGRGGLGYPYGYSVWVPDYYDSLDYDSQYAPYGPPPPAYYGPPPAAAGAPPQPVIINQYFGGPPPGNAIPQNGPETGINPTGGPGDPIGPPQNYYLIAYKNHAVYTALAYWVEDKTLHYVTTENTHNQASLDLIDLDLTKTLNKRNDVPFSLPGQ
jgi:hypothetical protein